MLLFDRRRYLSTSPNHRPFFHWFILVLSSLQLVQYVNSQESDQRVKLTDVQTITLFKDRYTNSRRLNSIPQLRCIGSFWKCQNYAPNVVQCYNKGFDGIDVQWECKADLDKTVKFGIMKVVCEGYSFPDDSYILANSCGLEYSLELSRNRNYDYYNSNLYETSKLSNFLTLLIMVVIILAVYKTCNKNRELELRRELNGTYAHVIDGPGTGGVGDVYASPLSTHHGGYGGGYFTSAAPNSGAASSNLFPPPPPPYGSLVMPTSTTGSSTLPTNEVSSATTVAANLSAPSGRLNQPDIEVASAAGAAAQATSVVALGDDKPVDASAAAASQSTAAAAQAAASAALSTNAAASTTPSSTWASFLAGSAAVSGYLLNRRNTSPRRSDSPPPSYEETRTLQAANVNSNSNSNSNSTSNGSNSRR